MASLTRVRIGCFLNNFANVLIKQSCNFQKNKRALFHCSSFLNGPGIEIKMPSLSPTMIEGKIVKWLKKEGDIINPGDVICDIETDKAVVSMEVEDEGILAKIVVPENSPVIKVGSLIALMVSEDEDWKNVTISAEEKTPGSSSSLSTSGSESERGTNKNGLEGPPTTFIKMPSLSPTMTSGTIVKWFKKEGDIISPGDVLCDIQTDKAVMAMDVDEEGILAKIIFPDGSTDVKVGTVIGLIVPEGEDWKSVVVDTTGSSGSSKAKEPTLQSQITSFGVISNDSRGNTRNFSDLGDIDEIPEKLKIRKPSNKTFGPAVKFLLASYQLEPGLIKPTGKNNRLLKEDVTKYIKDNQLEKKPPKVVSAPAVQTKSPSLKPESVHEKAKEKSKSLCDPQYIDIEMGNVRQVIAKRLIQSKRDIPHSYAVIKCEVNEMMKAKNKLEAHGTKVSLNDCMVKATALALQLYPKANAVCIKNEVQIMQGIDISVAVATDLGLFTPFIKSANLKSVAAIGQEIKTLAGKARLGKLKPQEFTGGTFTISNLGMFGVTHFKAIINPPQCGILAIGTTTKKLRTNLAVFDEVVLTMSFDRRALEEPEAAEFMEILKYVIENPKLIAADRSISVLS